MEQMCFADTTFIGVLSLSFISSQPITLQHQKMAQRALPPPLSFFKAGNLMQWEHTSMDYQQWEHTTMDYQPPEYFGELPTEYRYGYCSSHLKLHIIIKVSKLAFHNSNSYSTIHSVIS